MAKQHFRVIKTSGTRGKTDSVSVEILKKKAGRVEELARMLGASADEKASRKLATGMLNPD